MSKKRLSKALAAAGLASRRACEELIFDGRVVVNGQIVKEPQTLVDFEKDVILCNGEQIGGEHKKVYYLLNKPVGYLCSHVRKKNERLVLDLVPDRGHRLFTVGRLDKETQGLIIVTNDGEFANRLMHPSANIQREYLAKTFSDITHEHLVAISEGTMVEDVWVKPIRVKKVRKGTVKVVVGEGRKREVRLLLKAAGLEVRELTRIRIGGLLLGKLPLGACRILTEREREALLQ